MARATIYLADEALWHDFRLACLERRLSASEVMKASIELQLSTWQAENNTTQELPGRGEQQRGEPPHA